MDKTHWTYSKILNRRVERKKNPTTEQDNTKSKNNNYINKITNICYFFSNAIREGDPSSLVEAKSMSEDALNKVNLASLAFIAYRHTVYKCSVQQN